MLNPAIVVQCFNKVDTLEAVCRSLLRCTEQEKFDLIIWSDSPVGSRNPELYVPAHRDVLALIASIRPECEAAFRSVEVHGNEVNAGPYKTAELAVNHAFHGRDFVIFAEDDAVFAADALTWFLACAETDEFRSDRVWAIAGESIFFNARAAELPEGFRRDAIAYTRQEGLIDKFSELPFIPSTCFATSRQKWSAIGPTRGLSNGDVALCQRCENEGKTCIQPIVARVRDIGMLHDLGYSVSIHTKAGVQEIKNTYLTSDELAAEAAPVAPRKIDPSRPPDLYRRSTLLEGFGETPLQPPPSAPARDIAPTVPNRSILSRTLALIEAIPPGTFVSEEQKCFDEDELNELGAALTRLLYAPSQIRRKIESLGTSIVPANFYSEIPTQFELAASFARDRQPRYDAVFADDPVLVNYLLDLTTFSAEFDPPRAATLGQFHWENGSFSYSDAMSYYAMLRKLQPQTVIEIGCGWSTYVALAALNRNGNGRIIGIEPFPQPFLPKASNFSLIERSAQEIPAEFFNTQLASGDVLFIDSTHTVKHGSDCLHLYLQVLPRLHHDLSVHVHDVFLPNTLSFETLRDKQIYWTEQYLLYAYLLGNPKITTLYGSAYHNETHPELLSAFMHGRFGSGGGSFWFQQRP